MIEAVTYGMIPSAKREKRDRAEPLNRLSRPRTVLALAVEVVLDRGGVDTRRRHPRAEPVGGEDGSREQHPAPQLRDSPGVGEPGQHGATPRSPSRPRAARQPRLQPCPRSALGRLGLARSPLAAATALGLPHLRLLQQRQGAAGRLDLLARGRRSGVHGDRERRRQLADPEQLHVLANRADQALRLQRLGRDLLAGLEAVEVADVHRLGVRPERPDRHRVARGAAAELREPHRERHLAAFEAGPHHVRPGARLLALDAAARVAALAGAHAAADALAVAPGLRRAEIGQVQLGAHEISSTFTRWRTLRSMPAIDGVDVVIPGLADPAEAERPQRAAVARRLADGAARLGEPKPRHRRSTTSGFHGSTSRPPSRARARPPRDAAGRAAPARPPSAC